jgi:branched-subunit amino acid transport protein AzlD
MLNIFEALAAAVVMAMVIVFCRALPFLFFAGRKPPSFLSFIEVYMPAIAMTVLAVSSYTSIDWTAPAVGAASVVAGATVIVLHFWKRNALLSILGGTLLYMFLSGLLAR